MTLSQLFNRRKISTEVRFQVLERDQYACVYCKQKVDFYSARFASIWHQGKSFVPSVYSLRACCAKCDLEKADRSENAFWFSKILKTLHVA